MSPPSNRNLVIAHLQGSNQTVIRDVTDINHPSTVATPTSADGWASDGWSNPSFVSPASISYTVNDSQLDRAWLPGSGAVQVLSWCYGNYLVAYRCSPDGQTLTYVMEPSSWMSSPGVAFDWHLVSNGVDRVIGTAPPWCHCGNGSEDGDSRAEDATKQAVSSPLLETSIDGAKGILFNITAGKDITLQEVQKAAEIVRSAADPGANIIFGVVRDDTMAGEIKITVLARWRSDRLCRAWR